MKYMNEWESVVEYAKRNKKSRQHIYMLIKRGKLKTRLVDKVTKVLQVKK